MPTEGTTTFVDELYGEITVENKELDDTIVEYLKENHPDIPVIKFEQDTKEYEVKLKGGIELTFDKQFRLIDYDD